MIVYTTYVLYIYVHIYMLVLGLLILFNLDMNIEQELIAGVFFGSLLMPFSNTNDLVLSLLVFILLLVDDHYLRQSDYYLYANKLKCMIFL